MVAKGNQPQLQADIQRLFERAAATANGQGAGIHKASTHNLFAPLRVRAVGDEPDWVMTHSSQVELGHGRLERRTMSVLAVPAGGAWLSWPGAAQVFRLQREVTHKKDAKHRSEVVYGLTSLTPGEADATQVLQMSRSHWGIENGLHWVRDVLWDEDRCRAHSGNAPQVLAAARNVAIALLRRLCPHNLAQAVRRCAAQPHLMLKLLTEN